MINKLNEILKEYQQNISNLIENSTKFNYSLKKHHCIKQKINCIFIDKLENLKQQLKELKKQLILKFNKELTTKQINKINYLIKITKKENLHYNTINK